MIDVSVIVPVYNTEKYLKDCLDSLVNQTYNKSKYEIILVNDNSTDKSLTILESYKERYGNVVIYSFKKNKGVSSARNFGIKKAKGKYLIFCDSDDKYDLNSIEVFMNCAKNENADFIVADYFISKEDKKISANSTNCFMNKYISKKDAISYMTLTSCSKLIKKDLFTKNNIYYPENLKNCEELPVIPVLSFYANKVVKLDNCLYYYVQRKTSASNFYNNKFSDLSYFDESFNRFTDLINGSNYREEIEFRAIDHLLYGKCLVMLKSKISTDIVIKYIDAFKYKYPDYTKNRYLKKYNKFKKIFIMTLNFKFIFGAKILAYVHMKITG